jgi:hypothetical protein
MIELPLKAIDRIIELARIRDKRLRARYEEIYKPSFLELQQVHSDYMRLVGGVVARLDELRGHELFGNSQAIDLLADVSTQRDALLPIRQKLHSLHHLLEDTQHELPEVERNFLGSLVEYFSLSGLSRHRNESAPRAILNRLEASLSARIETPHLASELGNVIPDLGGPIEELIEYCLNQRIRIESSWLDAAARFNDLRVAYTASVS